jgi:hypothetical protein
VLLTISEITTNHMFESDWQDLVKSHERHT